MSIPGTLVLLHLDERNDYDGAVDAAGNLEPMFPRDVAEAFPVAEDAMCGRGRRADFASNNWLQAKDAAGRDTLATRDVTVQVLMSIDDESTVTRYVYQRGLAGTGGSSEYTSMAVAIKRLVVGGTNYYEVWCEWQTSAGTKKEQAHGVFAWPGAGKFFLLTVTRRWESPTKVVVRYYVGDRRIGEFESVDGDIGGATTGTTAVGGGYSAAATPGEALVGVVDELKVTNYEMSHEEVRSTWLRLARYSSEGVALAAAMMPPGSGWGRDPGTRWGKLVNAAGQALGLGLSKAEELRDTWLPDRAYQGDLDRWERLYNVPRGQLDSLDLRRSRVVGYSSRDNGFSRDQILDLLEEALNRDSSAMTYYSFDNELRDGFSALSAERWFTSGSWSIASNEATITVAGGSDLRWDKDNRSWLARLITPLSTQDRQRFVVVAKFNNAGLTTVSSDALIGICMFNWRTGEAFWFGERNDGTSRLAWAHFNPRTGVFTGPTVLASNPTWPGDPVWLRIVADPVDVDKYTLGFATAGEEGPYTEYVVDGVMQEVEWVGLDAVGFDASTASGNTITCDEFILFEPEGTRPLSWYVYAAPGSGENPELANLLVRKSKPAHTHAAAIFSTSLKCDDARDGLCDRGAMGAL